MSTTSPALAGLVFFLSSLGLLATACGDKDDTEDTGPDEEVLPTDDDADGWSVEDGDCDDGDSEVHPEAAETCDGVDNDCDGAVDEDDAVDAGIWYADADGDGFGGEAYATTACEQPEGFVDVAGDCHDGDADWYPGAPEDDCADANDYNCDGSVGSEDADGDGHVACEDCNDADGEVSPDADEVCDEVDNDCDGAVDEEDAVDAGVWYEDRDEDGYGNADLIEVSCDQPGGFVEDATDCDDGETEVNPGAEESCDGVDNDCDGTVDEDEAVDAGTWFADSDGDGAGDAAVSTDACDQPDGYVADDSDCDDTTVAARPGLSELCDELDNDCDGTVDEDDALDAGVWYADGDGDGYGDGDVSTTSCSQPSEYVADGTDCDDGDSEVSPGGTEVCNELDDDCDGSVDEDATDATSWYLDGDGDGQGGAGVSVEDCEAPSSGGSWVDDDSDCDDGDVGVYAGAVELCDGMANDCDTASSWVAADEDGTVSFEDGASGEWTDVTSAWAAGTSSAAGAVSLGDDGELWVCPGTWYVNVEVTATELLISGRGDAEDTVLDGAGSGSVVSPKGAGLELEALTITGGSATEGGGLYVTNSSDVVVRDCVVEDNEATDGGGAYVNSSALSIEDSQVSGNVADDDGGAVFGNGAELWISGSTVTANLAAGDGGGLSVDSSSTLVVAESELTDNEALGTYGGAIRCTGCDLEVSDSTLEDNSAPYLGGAILLSGSTSTMVLEGSTLVGNAAELGGAIYGGSGSFEVVDCTFSDNRAEDQGSGRGSSYIGGAVRFDSCTVSLETSVFSGNFAEDYGGAIGSYGATMTVSQCTVSGNEAYTNGGGGLFVFGGGMDLLMEDSAVSGNLAAGLGGGLGSNSGAPAVEISSSTFSGNSTSGDGGGVGLGGSVTATLTGVELTGNSAGDDGGAVFVGNSASADFDTCVVEQSYAVGDGGGLYTRSSTVVSTDFSSNSVGDVHNSSEGSDYTYGTGASFTCDSTSCY